MQRKNSNQDLEFDFFSLKIEFDEAINSHSKNDTSSPDSLNRSYSCTVSRRNNNIFSKILKFIPKEIFSNFFDIFQFQMETNKKSTEREIKKLRNEIDFEYKKKLLEILLFLLYSIKKSDSNNNNENKINQIKIVRHVTSFTLEGDLKYFNNTEDFDEISMTKNLNEIQSSNNVNIIYNYTESKNVDIKTFKEKELSTEPVPSKHITPVKDKSKSLEQKKLSDTEKKRMLNSTNKKETITLINAASAHKIDKGPNPNIQEEMEVIAKDRANNSNPLKVSNYNSYPTTHLNNKLIQNNPHTTDNFNQTNPINTTFNNVTQTDNKMNNMNIMNDPKYYYLNNFGMSFPYLNNDIRHYNHMDYSNIHNINYNPYKNNLSFPLFRPKINFPSPTINPLSTNPMMYPWLIRQNPSIPLIPQSIPTNKINNIPVVNHSDNTMNSRDLNSFTNMNPYYSTNDCKKKENREINKENQSSSIKDLSNNHHSSKKSNEFLNKKKKRDAKPSNKSDSHQYYEGDSFGEKSIMNITNSIKENDEVHVKIFHEDISTDSNVNCSTMDVDRSILISSNLDKSINEVSLPSNSTLSDTSRTKAAIQSICDNEDDILKQTIRIFSEQFTMQSLDNLKQVLKLTEEKYNLIKEYLVYKNYPKNKREYIFLFKKEKEDKGLYLKIDPTKKKYSLIRHKIFKE